MKKVLTSIFLAALCAFTFGQKLDKEKLGTYHYTQLPYQTTLLDYATYSVEAIGMNADAYRRDEIKKYVNMAGYNRVSGNADFVVKVEEYPIQFGDADKKSKTNTTKDKDGKEVKKTVYFWNANYTYKYKLEILNRLGEVIYTRSIEGEDVVSSGEKGSYKAAGEAYSVAVDNILKAIIKEKVSALLGTVNEQLCYVPKHFTIKYINVKPKKYDYPEFEEGLNNFTAGYNVVMADPDNIEAARADLEATIALMENALAESNVEDRKARINESVTAGAYYNIAQCYFMMQDYASAAEYVEKAAGLRKNMTNDQQYNSNLMLSQSKRYTVNYPN